MLNSLLAIFEGLTPMNGANLVAALNILWKGVLAIFIVIALIIAAVKAVSYGIQKADEAKKQREENANRPNDQTNG